MKEIIPFSHTDAKAVFGFRAKEKDRIYLGTELELEATGNREICAEEANKFLNKFCVIKNDSTIKNGFEIASAPCGLTFHQRNWNGFFKYCKESKNLFEAENVGMHVHLSKKPLSSLQCGKIIVFINHPKNKDFISLIAGRNILGHRHCKINENIKSPKWALKKVRNQIGYDTTAVRFSYRHTLEFRIFSSTTDRNIFLKNIEFCHALAKFCRPCFLSIKESQQVEIFCSYIKDEKSKYPHLYKFLVDAGKIKP